MFDVVGVGANSVDHVYRLPEYPRPDSAAAKLRITSHVISCGGQTATTLCACAAMGRRVKYIGTIGSDENGRRIREELAHREVDITDVIAADAPNPYAVILLDTRQGERIVLWDRDPRLALLPDAIPAAAIASARLLHVDDVDVNAAIAAALLARDAGIVVTSDIEAVTDRTPELIAQVTVPILAEHVPAVLTGESDPERALRRLRRHHRGMLCVTLGARGAMLLDGDRLHHEPSFHVDVVDTTGAGDVFRGAFIHALLRGDDARAILRFANAAAAVSCTRLGAIHSVPTVEDVNRLLAGRDSNHEHH